MNVPSKRSTLTDRILWKLVGLFVVLPPTAVLWWVLVHMAMEEVRWAEARWSRPTGSTWRYQGDRSVESTGAGNATQPSVGTNPEPREAP